MFEGVLGSSILQKAQDKDAVHFRVVNFRAFSDNKHQTVDDYPYGGGAGMVLGQTRMILGDPSASAVSFSTASKTGCGFSTIPAPPPYG